MGMIIDYVIEKAKGNCFYITRRGDKNSISTEKAKYVINSETVKCVVLVINYKTEKYRDEKIKYMENKMVTEVTEIKE